MIQIVNIYPHITIRNGIYCNYYFNYMTKMIDILKRKTCLAIENCISDSNSLSMHAALLILSIFLSWGFSNDKFFFYYCRIVFFPSIHDMMTSWLDVLFSTTCQQTQLPPSSLKPALLFWSHPNYSLRSLLLDSLVSPASIDWSVFGKALFL